MKFSSNIKLLRKRKGRTQDEMAMTLKMKRSTLSGYENEIARPNISALIALSEYFEVSIDTLVKTDLSLLSESQLSELERGNDIYIKGSQLRVLTTTVDSRNNENIELVHEKAKAGYTSGFADPEFIKELPAFNLPFLSKEKKYRTFQINGDSMLPITDGSWITAEFVQNWNTIKSGEAYIILTVNDGIVFKVAENKIASSRKLILSSLNPLYKPYELKIEDVKEVWKFIHFINSDLPDANIPQEELQKTVENLKNEVNLIKMKIETL